VFQVAVHLVHRSNALPDQVRLFGFNALEHLVRTGWNEWSSEKQASFKSTLLALIMDVSLQTDLSAGQ
jgi:hypothetical protein